MTHGTQCSCMMCGIGKKVGMIKNEDDSPKTCTACGHEHGEDGTCECGCG